MNKLTKQHQNFKRPETVQKDLPCKHHQYNLWLIEKKMAKDYLEAMATVRTFMCNCKKCHPLKVYAGQI